MTDLSNFQLNRQILVDAGGKLKAQQLARLALINKFSPIKVGSLARMTLMSGSAGSLELQTRQTARMILCSLPPSQTYSAASAMNGAATLSGTVNSVIRMNGALSATGTLTADGQINVLGVRANLTGTATLVADATSIYAPVVINADAALQGTGTINANAIIFTEDFSRPSVGSGTARIPSTVRNMIPKFTPVALTNYVLSASANLQGTGTMLANVDGASYIYANLTCSSSISATATATYYKIVQMYPYGTLAANATIETGGGAPAWLTPTATAGISFVDNEAWIDGTLISDLTTILGGNFSTSYMTAGGYDTSLGDPSNGGTTILCTGALLTFLSNMDWAFRIEWEQLTPYLAANYITAFDTINYIYAECYSNGSRAVYCSAYDGDYNPVGDTVDNVVNVIAGSNNATGWVASVNGATAVLSAPQSTFTADSIALVGSNYTGDVDPYNGVLGVIKKIEFFPLKTAAEIEALAT